MEDHPVNDTKKSLYTWTILAIVLILTVASLILAMVISPGRDRADSSTHLSAQSINSPEQLPSDLVKTKIVFRKRQDGSNWLYLTNLGGPTIEDNLVKLNGSDPELSPEAEYLVYRLLRDTSEEGNDKESDYRSSIWIRDLSDGTEREIILWPERFEVENIGLPNFFPSGDKLIFSNTKFDTNQYNLATINLDGSNLEIIETKPNTFNELPAISPDGEKILVACEGFDADSGEWGFWMLCIMNLDGSERILLTNDGDNHGLGIFSPDSQTIFFSEIDWGGLLGLIDKPRYELKSNSIDGNNLLTILDWRWPFTLLAISEDGGEMVFMESPQDETPPRLYVVQTNGENLRHLTYFDDFLEEWYAEAE